MTYATEKERVEAKRASRRKVYWGEPKPRTNFYPETRAPRADLASMTDEERREFKKQKDREKCARWNARNPGVSRAALRTRRAENPWYQCLFGVTSRAKLKGLECDLTAEWAQKTFTGTCSLTGFPFINRALTPAGRCGGDAYSPSIDRINPLKGYTQDNCRWVLFAVNSFKGLMSDQEMIAIAKALVEHQKNI